MPGIGKYKKGKAFSLRSGNKPSGFKMMGSSKASPAKDLYIHRPDGSISKLDEKNYSQEDLMKRYEKIMNQNAQRQIENEESLDAKMAELGYDTETMNAYFNGELDDKNLNDEISAAESKHLNSGLTKMAVDKQFGNTLRKRIGGDTLSPKSKKYTTSSGMENFPMSERMDGFDSTEEDSQAEFLDSNPSSNVYFSSKIGNELDDEGTPTGTGSNFLTHDYIGGLKKEREELAKQQNQTNPIQYKDKKSPVKKPLVGNQKNLPEHLQKKILASPAKAYGKKSAAKMKDLSGDGKITKKDVLIGRGVIKKDSPAKAYKKSPVKNYKNPQDYKVFNMGNKPTPVKKHKKY